MSPHQGWSPCPLHWKHRTLTTGLPEKSPDKPSMWYNSSLQVWLHNTITWETEKQIEKHAFLQDQLNQNLWDRAWASAFLKSSEVILMQSRLKATVREERKNRQKGDNRLPALHSFSLPPILYRPLSCPFPVVIH